MRKYHCTAILVKQNKEFIPSSNLGHPVGVTNEVNVEPSFSRSMKSMCVTTALDDGSDNSNKTMSFIKENFKLRDQMQKEIWLIGLEISGAEDVEER